MEVESITLLKIYTIIFNKTTIANIKKIKNKIINHF